jgi:hypothetical protein
MVRFGVLTGLLLLATAAEAYIGPGAGASIFGSLWAILVGVFVALAAVLAWPIRWAWRRLRRLTGHARRDTTTPTTPDSGA